MIKFLLFVLAFLFSTPSHVQAYLDPGTGSYVTQIIIGIILGGLYAVKIYWRKIVNFYKVIISFFKKNGEKPKVKN